MPSDDPLLKKTKDFSFKKLISKETIEQRIQKMALEIDRDVNGEELVIVMVMKGALCVTADVLRYLQTSCVLEFISTSSYGQGGMLRGRLKIEGVDTLDLKEKNVLVIDDIFDSGVTLFSVVERLAEQQPKTLRSLVLLSKKARHEVDYVPDYILFEIEDQFVVGYGMDYKEHWRELPAIYAIE